jgi:hypothetical protein
MQKKRYDRDVLALDDTQLEHFVLDWVKSKTASYVETTSFSGPGDLGRDVVGFLTRDKHEGAWDNYQCKQYAKPLPTDTAIREIGKILYHAFNKEFSAPTNYYFVVPRGVNRNLEKLIFNPSEFKKKIISEWNQYCANKIIDGQTIHLDLPLESFIDNFDFSSINRINLEDILSDAMAKSVLFKWFGADPGPAPPGIVPDKVENVELPYINQLVDAYSQHEGKAFASHADVDKHSDYNKHLSMQRERFYDADSFKRFYRDNTDKAVIEHFENDIYHGIFETCNGKHEDTLACVDAVMNQAANLQPAGPLAQHARVPVKQGVCHHFANEGRVQWRK